MIGRDFYGRFLVDREEGCTTPTFGSILRTRLPKASLCGLYHQLWREPWFVRAGGFVALQEVNKTAQIIYGESAGSDKLLYGGGKSEGGPIQLSFTMFWAPIHSPWTDWPVTLQIISLTLDSVPVDRMNWEIFPALSAPSAFPERLNEEGYPEWRNAEVE